MSYIVFSVESADRIVLMGPPINGKPQLKPVALSYVHAPKIAKRTISGDFGPEDPCAYDASEMIRSKFIGKPVRFTEDYFLEPLERSAGRLVLVDITKSGAPPLMGDDGDATVILLKEGLAFLPEHQPPNASKAIYDKYKALVAEARAAKRGLFAPGAKSKVRNLRNLSPDEMKRLQEKVSGQEILVRVERVLSPTSIIISSKEFGPTQVLLHFPGISSRDEDCVAISVDAKFHIEKLLLNRNVTVLFQGSDNHGNLIGSIVSKQGFFQEELLQRGFVKIQNTTLSFVSRSEEFKAAERAALEKGAGVWHNVAAKKASEAPSKVVVAGGSDKNGLAEATTSNDPCAMYDGPRSFTGTIVQFIHGDTLVVREAEKGTHIRLSLAGVRCSKNIHRDHDGNSPETRVTYSDFSWEAKDFMRSHYLGASVVVKVEFARKIQETNEIRPSATVTDSNSGSNIACALLEQGYASFFLGKTDVCSCAIQLKESAEIARIKKLGTFSGKPCTPVTIVELSHLGTARANYYLSFLQRGMQGGKPPLLKGIVDVAVSGNSLRIFIRKENFQIPVKVAGIIAPMSGGNISDLYCEEAKDFIVTKVQQRDVTLQVFGADRAGNFISSVMLADGTNVSIMMVRAGLATVANADRFPFYTQLIEAEEAAKKDGKFIWSSEKALPQRAQKMATERSTVGGRNMLSLVDSSKAVFSECMISEAGEDGLSVFIQESEEQLEELKQLILSGEKQFGHFDGNLRPKKGDIVLALYKSDNSWYRAKVLHTQGSDSFEVQFVDYGSRDTVKREDMRVIPRDGDFKAIRSIPHLARKIQLAFLKTSLPNDFSPAPAVDAVYEYTEGDVLVKPVYRDASGSEFYTVTVNENVSSLSETLLQRGLAILDSRVKTLLPSEFKRHEAAQEIARRGHKGMWQYGDIDDNDEIDGY